MPDWATEIFDPDLPGSFTHFYQEMSFGRHLVHGEVIPRWYESDHEREFYLSDSESEPGRFTEFSLEILRRADADIDFARFDNDGPDGLPNSGDDDGVADVVFIAMRTAPTNFLIGSATGIAFLGPKDDLRPGVFVTDDTDVAGSSIFVSYEQGTIQAGSSYPLLVGSMTHEYGHVLGLPDLYNTEFLQSGKPFGPEDDSAGIDAWGLMGWGTLGWNGNDGPNSFSAWSRAQLGWTDLLEVGIDTESIQLAEVGTGGRVVKVPLDEEEYFLLEHRRAGIYYDRHLPGAGLLIWHVQPSGTGVPLIDLECADGRWRDKGHPLGKEADPVAGGDNLDFWAHHKTYALIHQGNLGDATDPFDGVRYTAFTPTTNPSSYRADGLLSARVEDIRFEGGLALADIEAAPRLVGSAQLRMPDDLAAFSGREGRAFEVTGHLNVTESGLSSLAGLRGLVVVDGYLNINGNAALTSLDGLNDLTHVGGDLVIDGNQALANLAGLDNLTRVEGAFVVRGNTSLLNLEGLSKLTHVGGDLVIRGNEALASIETLRGLTSVEGGVMVSGNIALASLEGLSVHLKDRINPEWMSFTTDNSGLPSNGVTSLAVDFQGNVWIGTREAGVAKFDGRSWQVHDTDNSALPSNGVQSLAVDFQENVWIGNDAGVAKFDGRPLAGV